MIRNKWALGGVPSVVEDAERSCGDGERERAVDLIKMFQINFEFGERE